MGDMAKQSALVVGDHGGTFLLFFLSLGLLLSSFHCFLCAVLFFFLLFLQGKIGRRMGNPYSDSRMPHGLADDAIWVTFFIVKTREWPQRLTFDTVPQHGTAEEK